MKPFLPQHWRWGALATVLNRQRDLVNPSQDADAVFNSVGLEDIGGGGTGEITVQQVTGCELESTKAAFAENDLLYGRLRPYLNKAAIAPCDGVCSTEIWVFRPSAIVETDFAFWMLVSPYLLKRVARITEGANLPRVDAEGFDRIEIPLPPLSEQRRIVEILNEAGDIRLLRRQANDLTAKLVPTIFNDMFGDPLLNPRDWPVEPLSHFFRISPNYGTMTPVDDSEDGVVCIRVGDIQQNRLDVSSAGSVPRQTIDVKRHIVRAGDIVLVRAIGSLDHLGKSVVIEDEQDGLAFDSHLMRVRFDERKLLPHFVHSLFLTPGGRRLFLKNTRQSAVQVNINTDEYGRIRVPCPPLELQKDFVTRVQAVRAFERDQGAACSLEQETYQSLLNSLA